MTFPPLDPLSWIPDATKRQIVDDLVKFLMDKAGKTLGDEFTTALGKLKSDAAFQDAVDAGLKRATDHFLREYANEDKDLTSALSADLEFWKAKSVREALLAILHQPGRWEAQDWETVANRFDDVLPQRRNRERVDRAVRFFLRCLAEEVWHLPELRPIYEMQMNRISLDRAEAMLHEVQGMRTDFKQAMLTLAQGMAEQQRLLAGSARPALPEHPKVYHNLPTPDYIRFVGRESELAELRRLLSPDHRIGVISIDGIGGIGKSALALESAHCFLREYDELPDNERFQAIIWASAKVTVLTADGIAPRPQITRTLDDIYTTVAITLQREDISHAHPDAQDEVVCRALAHQRTLLIIDNLETIDDERVNAFLREVPAPTKCIVTTRHRIDVAYPIRLTAMPSGDALALIAQEGEKKGVTLTDEETDLLYRRTGGVPLAIVWSIAQMGFGWGAGAVLNRLGDAKGDIAHYCFESALERVHEKPAGQLLMALSLFATDASREALGYVAALPELDRDEGLVELERLSLVNKLGKRFAMLPLTKGLVSAAVNLEAHKRFVEFFVSFCQQQVGTQYWDSLSYDVQRLQTELENLFLAFDWAFTEMDWRAAQNIFVALVHPLALSSVSISKRVDLAQRALMAAENLRDMEMQAWIHVDALGYGFEAIGKPEQALDHIQSGQIIAQKARLADCLSVAESHLARWAMHHQDRTGALSHIESALALAQCPPAKVRAYKARARLYAELGQWEKATESLLRGIEAVASVSDNLDETGFRMSLGRNYIEMGRLDSAEKEFVKARELAMKYKWSSHLANALMGLARISSRRGAAQPARDYAEQAKALYDQFGDARRVEEANRLLETLDAPSKSASPHTKA